MARLRIEPAGIEFDVREGETVLAAARRSGLRWPTVCGGQAECTACAFEVVGEPDGFSPVDERERVALARLPERRLRPEVVFRLACQTRLRNHGVARKRGIRAIEPRDAPNHETPSRPSRATRQGGARDMERERPQTASATDSDRLRRLEAREDIRDLLARYCFVQDRGHASHAEADVHAFLALCTDDVVWDNSADLSRAHRGPEAVATYLRRLWTRFDSCMHFVHNVAIEIVDDDHARSRASFDAAGDIGGEAFVAAGYYEDEYRHTAAGWRFALHRELPFYFVKVAEGWAGPKPRIMREWASTGGGA